MKFYWTYVLSVVEVNELYIGSTSDLIRRVREHKGGWKGSYLTGKYTFLSVLYCYPCILYAHARLLEEYLKYCYKCQSHFIFPNCGGIDVTNKMIAVAQANPEKRIKDRSDWSRYKYLRRR